MARRASSKAHPGMIIGAIIAIAMAVFAGNMLMSEKSAAFGDVSPLEINELLENGNMLSGNEYVIEGQIDEKLQWTADRGQLVSLKVESPGGEEFIGIEIPQEFNKNNISAKQRYAFRLKFKQGGVPVATGINRL